MRSFHNTLHWNWIFSNIHKLCEHPYHDGWIITSRPECEEQAISYVENDSQRHNSGCSSDFIISVISVKYTIYTYTGWLGYLNSQSDQGKWSKQHKNGVSVQNNTSEKMANLKITKWLI